MSAGISWRIILLKIVSLMLLFPNGIDCSYSGCYVQFYVVSVWEETKYSNFPVKLPRLQALYSQVKYQGI